MTLLFAGFTWNIDASRYVITFDCGTARHSKTLYNLASAIETAKVQHAISNRI
jgi:hypothetical protein